MEKTKFAYLSDGIIRTAAIWLLSAICIRYFIKELFLIIGLAVIATLIISFAIKWIYKRKHGSKTKITEIDNAMTSLIATDRFRLCATIAHNVNGTVSNDLCITDSTIIYPYFCGKLTLERLNYAYSMATSQNKRLIILCDDIMSDINKHIHLFSGIKVAILTKQKAYGFLSKYNALPTVKPQKQRVKLKNIVLNKHKVRGYLISAIMLLILSSFSPYSLLCILSAAANISLAIITEAVTHP